MLDNLALMVCAIGFVVYVIGSELPVRPWVTEVGRLAFFAGLLAFLLVGVKT